MRRTPELTKVARNRFIDLWQDPTIPLYDIFEVIAAETGLTHEQVRDAVTNEATDEWRRSSAGKVQS